MNVKRKKDPRKDLIARTLGRVYQYSKAQLNNMGDLSSYVLFYIDDYLAPGRHLLNDKKHLILIHSHLSLFIAFEDKSLWYYPKFHEEDEFRKYVYEEATIALAKVVSKLEKMPNLRIVRNK